MDVRVTNCAAVGRFNEGGLCLLLVLVLGDGDQGGVEVALAL